MQKVSMLKVCVVIVFVLVIFGVYYPGTSGALYYDDHTNLGSLSEIRNSDDARDFVFGGDAGPLGRPIALATFLIHANNWPHNLTSVLMFNVCIHIGNALLLLLLGYQLVRLATSIEKQRAFYIALFASLLWALLPIQVSSSLIAVQRMTGLAAFFGLIGLNLFAAAYFIRRINADIVVVGQLLMLAIFTVLSMLSKESGALIPIFALLIDGVIIKRRVEITRSLLFRRTVLFLLLLSLLYYLSPLFRDWFSFSNYRGFSVVERVQTEWIVLWQYVRLSLFPLPSLFSPFHDEVRIVHDNSQIIIAFGAWVVLFLVSVLLHSKTRWPLFALLWFFVGHLLESTSISLELYFEHRNYLALYGFCLALSYAAFSFQEAHRKLAVVVLGLYISIVGAACLATTNLWGQPKKAAIIWAVTNEESSRSALHLASLPVGDELAQQQWRYEILPFLDQTIDACAGCIDVQLQALLFSCSLRDSDDIRSRFDQFLKNSVNGESSIPVVDGLFPLISLSSNKKCGDIGTKDIDELIGNLISNPAFRSQLYITRLYYLKAEQEYLRGDLELASKSLLIAERKGPSALPVLQFQVHLAIEQNNYVAAMKAVERRHRYIGRSINITAAVLDKLKLDVSKAELEKSLIEHHE